MVKEKIGFKLGDSFNAPILSWLADHPGDYLEIGCYWGVFFSEVAEANPQHMAYAIDPHIADGHTGQERGFDLSHIKKEFLHNISGSNNVVFWNSTTKRCYEEERYEQIENISCVLVDGSHHYEDIKVDIDFIANIKRNQEVLVYFDDLHISDVVQGIDYFKVKMDQQIATQVDQHSFILKPSTKNKSNKLNINGII
jgi:hypothetical protein